jgi:hypothetical protein
MIMRIPGAPHRARTAALVLGFGIALVGSNPLPGQQRSSRLAVPPRVNTAQVIARGAMSATDRPRIHRVTLLDRWPAWEFILETNNPDLLDLDLYIYGGGSEAQSQSAPLCVGEGVESTEICRVLASGPVTVQVIASGGDGRSEFTLSMRPLEGPRLAGTPLLAEDARPLAAGTWLSPVSGTAGRTETLVRGFSSAALFEVRWDSGGAGQSWRSILTSPDLSDGVRLRAFNAEGHPLRDSSRGDGVYQDLIIPADGGRAFLLVTGRRPGSRFNLGLFRSGAPVPVPDGVSEWIASGQDERHYSLKVAAGETAIIELEGTQGQLAVKDGSGQEVRIRRVFGQAQQLAWIGDRVGSSPFVLSGVNANRALEVSIVASRDSIRYQRPATWNLHIHRSTREPNYLVQFAREESEPWPEWWLESQSQRRGVIAAGGLKVYALQPRVAGPRSAPQLQQRSMAPESGSDDVYLARLAGPSGQPLNLAV